MLEHTGVFPRHGLKFLRKRSVHVSATRMTNVGAGLFLKMGKNAGLRTLLQSVRKIKIAIAYLVLRIAFALTINVLRIIQATLLIVLEASTALTLQRKNVLVSVMATSNAKLGPSQRTLKLGRNGVLFMLAQTNRNIGKIVLQEQNHVSQGAQQ